MNTTPTFTYIFRRRSETQDCQAQVVVISSIKKMTYAKLFDELAKLTPYPVTDFEEVHQEPQTSIVLDTWNPAIENSKPADMDFPAVKTYSNWWTPAVATPTGIY